MRLSCLLSCLLPLLLRLLLSSLYPGAWAMTFHLEVDGQNSNEQRHHCLFSAPRVDVRAMQWACMHCCLNPMLPVHVGRMLARVLINQARVLNQTGPRCP
jgi:hypothetical protein